MRIPSKSESPAAPSGPPVPEDLPSEIQIWLDRGWTIIPAKRRGLVLAGEKRMRGLGKVGVVVGVLLLPAFFFHQPIVGGFGLLLIVGCALDYRFNAKRETKFFPEPGEKSRVMERT